MQLAQLAGMLADYQSALARDTAQHFGAAQDLLDARRDDLARFRGNDRRIALPTMLDAAAEHESSGGDPAFDFFSIHRATPCRQITACSGCASPCGRDCAGPATAPR